MNTLRATFIQVELFNSTFLVTLDPDVVRQVVGVHADGNRIARILEPSVLTNHVVSLAREYAGKQERGVKRVVR